MNWRLKAHFLNFLAALPPPLSLSTYYVLQRRFGNLRTVTPVKHFEKATRLVEILNKAGFSLQGKTVFELGTGHTVNTPIALWLYGAAEVITVDLNPYLREELVLKSISYMREHTCAIKELFGQHGLTHLFDERLSMLLTEKNDLLSVLSLCGIDYLAPVDASKIALPDNSIDCYYSTNVIEHIPPILLLAIFDEARRVLKQNGAMVHYIDLRDHFWTSDPSISMVNFLQFQEKEWQRLAGNRFMYQNRMRAFEYRQFFDEIGLRLLQSEEEIDAASLRAIKQGMRLATRFYGHSADELSVVGLSFVGQFE